MLLKRAASIIKIKEYMKKARSYSFYETFLEIFGFLLVLAQWIARIVTASITYPLQYPQVWNYPAKDMFSYVDLVLILATIFLEKLFHHLLDFSSKVEGVEGLEEGKFQDSGRWREHILGADMPMNFMFLKLPDLAHVYLKLKYSKPAGTISPKQM